MKSWCFWTVEWRRLLRVPWTARTSNQSILKEFSPGCSLEVLMLKLRLQYFGHLMWRADSFEKTLMLGKIEGRRRRGWQRMRWFGWHHRQKGHGLGWTPGDGDGQGGLACCGSWGCKELDMTEQLNWTVDYNFSFFHLWLFWFSPSSSFPWWVWLKAYQFYFFKEPIFRIIDIF